MNIVRALDVALPELPPQIVRKIPPKLIANVVAKEHIEKGKPVVITKAPGSEFIFRFSPLQWQLLQMFDGVSTHDEIAERFGAETGTPLTGDDVREFTSYLQAESKLLYRTPMEQNIALQQELRASRGKKKKRSVDFADVTIKVWNNADNYITWLYPKVRFIFTPWFVWLSIAMFAVMGWMWWDRFGEIWSDSFAFYNFLHKSGKDLIEFWFLFGVMAAIHETSHGLVGKHFGATVERMGFSLMYFAPSFFCDSTQVLVTGGKWARIATDIAGIWLDLVVCFFATIVWWATPTGMPAHDWAYKVMMVTGIGVSLLNLNPLIKLDGYLMFSEFIGEPSLKETSTAYLTAWTRKHIFRFPTEVPYVPRRKRPFYIVYAILSGLYSYSLLSFLMVITYHILRSYSPEWAFVPAAAIGLWVFRSRVQLLGKFMKTLYLDKKQRVLQWFTPIRIALVAATLVVVMFLPIWPDFVEGPFQLQAGQSAVIRATVPGTVEQVSVQEGQSVAAGSALLQLRNTGLESDAALAASRFANATARENQAALQYADFAAAQQERQHQARNLELATERSRQLSITAPVTGVIVTPHASDLLGRSVAEGDLLLEVADQSQLRAEVYVPEFAMHDVRAGEKVRLLANGRVRPVSGTVTSLAPTFALAESLISKDQLQGINPPRFYIATVWLKNDGELKPGMIGVAKVLLAHRSLAGFGFEFTRDLISRKVW
jgi:putative peptide zinc metalloprotease protein